MKSTAYLAQTEKRFLSKVDKTNECWQWLGGKDRKGYEKFSIGHSRNPDGTRRNSMVSSHRFAYEMQFGPIGSHDSFHGWCVLHRCDNPSCVNQNHLFLGTNADNVHDMDAKGRRVVNVKRGAEHGNAILTECQVHEIFKRHRIDKVSQRQLSKEYGVCYATVNHIFTGRLWRHLGLVDGG